LWDFVKAVAGFFVALRLLTGTAGPVSGGQRLPLFLLAEGIALAYVALMLAARGTDAGEFGLRRGVVRAPLRWTARLYAGFFPVLCASVVAGVLLHLLATHATGATAALEKSEVVNMLTERRMPPGVRLTLALFAVFAAPVVEEVIFRGLLYEGLKRHLSVPGAMAASGALFGLAHGDAMRFLPLAVFGTFLAGVKEHTGSLLPAMWLHGVNNGFMLLMLLLALAGV